MILYFQIQQYERAAASLGMAVEEDPDNTQARISLAKALAAMAENDS